MNVSVKVFAGVALCLTSLAASAKFDRTKCSIPERFKDHPMFTTPHVSVNFGMFGKRGYYARPDVLAQPAKIKAAGAKWVTLNTHFCQESFYSTRIFPDFEWSAGENELVGIIQELHRQDLHILLKPCLICLDSSWMGAVRFPNNGATMIQGVTNCYWQTWFASLRTCLKYYADISEKYGVEGIILGAEYNGTTDMNEEWERTIDFVRQSYSGPLTYEFQTGELKQRDFEWLNKLDFLAISFYPSAAGKDWKERYDRKNWSKLPPVSLESMKEMLAVRKKQIQEISERFGNKPVIFSEIGSRSCRGSVMLPWDVEGLSPWDGEEQANYMEAVFQTFSDLPCWMGLSWWKWDETQTNRPHYSTDPLKDRGFIIQGKPAAEVLRRWSEKL